VFLTCGRLSLGGGKREERVSEEGWPPPDNKNEERRIVSWRDHWGLAISEKSAAMGSVGRIQWGKRRGGFRLQRGGWTSPQG